MKGGVASLVVMVVLLVALEPQETAAVNCDPYELKACYQALISPGYPPSPKCCEKLKEQEPCFCGYLKDPNLRPYIELPSAKKFAPACNLHQQAC